MGAESACVLHPCPRRADRDRRTVGLGEVDDRGAADPLPRPPGEVPFDGVAARDLALADVRGHVALVDDDPYLFATSVAENVRLARPGATDDEVAAALRVAGLGTWVDGRRTAHPDRRGTSRRLRRRAGTARAGAGRPGEQPVVVLDEPPPISTRPRPSRSPPTCSRPWPGGASCGSPTRTSAWARWIVWSSSGAWLRFRDSGQSFPTGTTTTGHGA